MKWYGEELEQFLAHSHSWIKITDDPQTLPPSKVVGAYLVLDDKYGNVQAIWNGEIWRADFLEQIGPVLEYVTYWQPLPDPPPES